MCLGTIKSTTERPRLEGEGWVVRYRLRGERFPISSLFGHGGRGSTPRRYRLARWYEAQGDVVGPFTFSTIRYYPAGFHVFRFRADAITYAAEVVGGKGLAIVRVRWTHRVAIGQEDGSGLRRRQRWFPCDVVRRIRHEEIIDA